MKKDPELVFQLTPSTAASNFRRANLAFWPPSIKAISLQWLSKKPLISGQSVIGGLLFSRCFAYILPALFEIAPNLKDGELLNLLIQISSLIRFQISWLIQQLEVDSAMVLLLLLNKVMVTKISETAEDQH